MGIPFTKLFYEWLSHNQLLPFALLVYIKQAWISPELWETLQRLGNLLRILLYFLNLGELWVYENVICFHVLVHSHTLWREVPRNTETKPLKDMSIGFCLYFCLYMWINRTLEILQNLWGYHKISDDLSYSCSDSLC